VSAFTGFFAYQIDRTMHSPRRLRVLVAALALIAVLGFAVLFQATPTENLRYGGASLLTATPAAVCPGETFAYPVSIVVEDGNSVSRITEGWCRADGICPRAQSFPPYYVNFVAGIEINTTATRTVPETLTPGGWEFRHCNETHSSGRFTVACYAVPLTIKDCAEE